MGSVSLEAFSYVTEGTLREASGYLHCWVLGTDCRSLALEKQMCFRSLPSARCRTQKANLFPPVTSLQRPLLTKLNAVKEKIFKRLR